MDSAREEVLGHIRRSTTPAASLRQSDYAAIPRHYKQTGTLERGEVLGLFIERLEDYECGVHRCPEAEVSGTIQSVLAGHGKQRIMLSEELPKAWLTQSFNAVTEADGVITGCTVAIAQTGTIVLAHGPGDGSRALTLLPDYHLCVVFEEQVVETVAEGLAKATNNASGLLTTISGPSATADIEMTRVKGVHGPRTLDVILVGKG